MRKLKCKYSTCTVWLLNLSLMFREFCIFNTAFLVGMELRSVHLSERLSSLPVNKESTSRHSRGSSPRGPCSHLTPQFSEVCRGCGKFGVLVFPVCVEGLRDQQYWPFFSCGLDMHCDVGAEIHKDLLVNLF